jgi:hypothetical protein
MYKKTEKIMIEKEKCYEVEAVSFKNNDTGGGYCE